GCASGWEPCARAGAIPAPREPARTPSGADVVEFLSNRLHLTLQLRQLVPFPLDHFGWSLRDEPGVGQLGPGPRGAGIEVGHLSRQLVPDPPAIRFSGDVHAPLGVPFPRELDRGSRHPLDLPRVRSDDVPAPRTDRHAEGNAGGKTGA